MLVRRQSKEPTGLYRIEVDGTQHLVVETDYGYFGCSVVCPHRGTRLEVSGKVRSNIPSIFCIAHCIAYSLVDGTCLENDGAENEDPGVLSTFSVRRDGDMFTVTLDVENPDIGLARTERP